ncbi:MULTISPECIES: hypothetical protein [Roseomonadaceae]|uniref:Uncharacterized protein n=1 Tax=Falsiroseomonas oleicola TaxID=2801474 RepID=A0ABS6H298_9PROT|nr:hypothetical protein [Roseomonas oleicola]MBU8542784.1 hypothetical protein [Roseomonas oleicola]
MKGKKRRLSLDQRATLPIADDNPSLEYLRLNRREICRTEINAAIRLFLVDEDPIPAHLLASAATEIMATLSGGKPEVGLNDLRRLLKIADISPELEGEIFEALLHPYNFLKHSSSDINIENSFSIEYITITIYTAVHSYRRLFGDLSDEMMVFYGIIQSWRIHWWKDAPDFEARMRAAEKFPLIGASRQKMCEFGRRMLQQARLRKPE